jgi:hypothetical protein
VLHDAGEEAIWHDNPDARTIGTILALVSGPAPMRGHIVAEAVDSDSRPVMDLIGGRHVETVETRQIVRHLLVQSALMPGISFVFDELLSFEGAEFYYRGFGSALAGTRFGDALSLFESAVPIGVEEEGSGALRINPPDGYVLRAEDKLVFVAADANGCRLSSSAAPPAWSLDCPYGEEESDATARVRCNTTLGASIRTLTLKHGEKPRLKMLVCGWRDDLGGMIAALDKKVAPGSELQIFCTLKAEQRNSFFRLGHLPDTHNLTVHHFVGHPEVRSPLRARSSPLAGILRRHQSPRSSCSPSPSPIISPASCALSLSLSLSLSLPCRRSSARWKSSGASRSTTGSSSSRTSRTTQGRRR